MAGRVALFFLVVVMAMHAGVSLRFDDGCIISPLSRSHRNLVNLYTTSFQASPDPVQGIHLSLAGSAAMRVVWLNPTPFRNGPFSPECIYGLKPYILNKSAVGISYTYRGGYFNLTLNTVLLQLGELTAVNKTFFYQCGDKNYGWSRINSFTQQQWGVTKLMGSHGSGTECHKKANCFFDSKAPIIGAVGDLSIIEGRYTIASLSELARSKSMQLLIHAGDITYADTFGGKTQNNSFAWVDYMNKIEPIVSRLPYMPSPGNHESEFDFAAYLNWLKVPFKESGSSSPFWYSFDYLGVHFLAFSTEHDFSQNSDQYRWIKADLSAANENRFAVPWIFVFGHRPLYCTSVECKIRCEVQAPELRSYLEDLLYHQQVDVFMSGHNHQYERSLPVYKEQALQPDYNNPQAPVYIVNGGAGNPSFNDPTFEPKVPWRAYDEPTFETGYLLFQATRTELRFQYMASKSGRVLDRFIITKTRY